MKAKKVSRIISLKGHEVYEYMGYELKRVKVNNCLSWDIFEPLRKNNIIYMRKYSDTITGKLRKALRNIDERVDCNSVRFIKSLSAGK